MSKDEKCTCKACKITVFHCQICKFVGFVLPSSSWLLSATRRTHCFCILNMETTVPFCRAISVRQLLLAVLYDNVFWNRCIQIFSFQRKLGRKRHPTDRPWMTTNIKTAIRKRQSAFLRHGKESVIYKFWRNKLQRDIRLVKRLLWKQSCWYWEN